MKLWSVQVLRFVAALLVVYLHAAQTSHSLTGHTWLTGRPGLFIGRAGVDIFFVISGFIITRTAKGLSTSEFVARRAQRILPLWLFASAIATVWLSITASVSWRQMLATVLFWPATNVLTGPVVPVGWTLCFEVLFYASFALVIWRRTMVLPIAAVFVGALLTTLLTRGDPTLEFLGNPLIFEFLAGVGLAYAPQWRPAVFALPIGIAWLIIGTQWPGTLQDGAPEFLAGHGAWLRLATMGVPAALIVWGTLQIEARKSVFTYLGDASYALYLTHEPVVLFASVFLIGAGLPLPIMILGPMAASVALSAVVYQFVEKPIMATLRRGGSGGPKPALAP